ncbi:MAG: ribulose-phosphate 3-epimerase [Sedimentisphaerales bacterium]|nr:ribulose-phosphate 3-epimerase [Sedimentisphaerales bacterium]
MPVQSLVERIRKSSPALSVSVLTGDWMNLCSELAVLENAGIELLHIDVMDGRIWSKITIGTSFVQGVKTSLLKDVHLLIDTPECHVESFVKAGVDIITFSAEYCKDIATTLSKIDQMQNTNDPARGIVKELSLNPSTPIERLAPFIKDIDVVVLLAVGPDTGSDNFISALPERIKQTRALRQDLLIFVDGAINKKNITEVAKMCPDVIVTGSAVFDGKDAAGNLKFMLDAIK